MGLYGFVWVCMCMFIFFYYFYTIINFLINFLAFFEKIKKIVFNYYYNYYHIYFDIFAVQLFQFKKMMPFFALNLANDNECGDVNPLYFKRNLVTTNTATNTTVLTNTKDMTSATANTSIGYVRSTPSALRDTLDEIPVAYGKNKFCHFSNESI
jgi:hypothetical protein